MLFSTLFVYAITKTKALYLCSKFQCMQFPAPVSITWIARFIEAELIGNNKGAATGINELHKVEAGDLVFVDHPKYYDKCIHSQASFIIINKSTSVPDGKTL